MSAGVLQLLSQNSNYKIRWLFEKSFTFSHDMTQSEIKLNIPKLFLGLLWLRQSNFIGNQKPNSHAIDYFWL